MTDVRRIIDHLAAQNPAAARRVGRKLLLTADSLAIFPDRGRLGRLSGTRELWAVGPYVLVYRVTGLGSVQIVRVWHASQDRPGGGP